MFSIRSILKNRKLKTIVFSVLTAVYILGLIVIMFNFQLGMILWAVAFIPSLAVFLVQKQLERDEAVEEVKQQALNTDDDGKTED